MRYPILIIGLFCLKASAENVVIESFELPGQITFDRVSNAVSYRVEWASAEGEAWTNVDALTAQWDISGEGSGPVTAAVPMLYRVVAVLSAPVPEEMVLIPAGVNEGTNPDTFGPYSLTNPASFYMPKYEVTKAQWDEVRAAGQLIGYTDLSAGYGKATNHPVGLVTWYDCVKWCNARSEKEGREPAYYTDAGFTQVYRTGTVSGLDAPYVKASAKGYRLPTDVEWEYAARGGVASRRFPWGDSDNISHARANYYASGDYFYDESSGAGYHPTYDDGTIDKSSPVGSFAPNGYALHDMAGNVWEWCYDWLVPGSTGPGRVRHGGSYGDIPPACINSVEGGSQPGDGFGNLGFRPVLPAGP